jgi:hypothetical protein
MRTRIGAAALAGAAVLASSTGAAPPAAATAATRTVRPGGAITATAGTTTLTDTTTGSTFACASSSMTGTLHSGSGLPGTGIGSVTAAAYRSCANPISPTLTPRGLPWHLNLVSYDAATGLSRGTISHLRLTLSAPRCSAVINGTSGSTADGMVRITYANPAGKLKTVPAGGTLHWFHVSGCAGLVRNGDPATLSAAYTLSPPQTITSP